MNVLQVVTFFLLALVVGAEKKIELQDIEEDNLRSEKEKDHDKSDSGPSAPGPATGPGFVSLDFLKNGFLKYFDNSAQSPQQQRYVHQYAVTEPPERPPPPSAPAAPKPHYGPPAPQQAMVGYLSNMPMQIYLVPQYYSDQQEQQHSSPQAPYQSPGVARVAGYHTAPEAVQTQTNYIEVPSYVAPTAKTYVQQYPQPVTYVSYPTHTQATAAPAPAGVTPVVTYQVPVVHYTSAVVAPTSAPKTYYQAQPQHYTETNSVDEVQEQDHEHKQYTAPAEGPYPAPVPQYPRHYNSRTPLRDDYQHDHRYNVISELPPPNPLILKASPPHLVHTPKALPIFHRPLTKPVYQSAASVHAHQFGPRQHEGYLPPPSFKRRPASLLDSYIPSSVQVEYLKRGLVKDPLSAYDAVASGRLPHLTPRHYERGFLPNQMYQTAAGGVTFGHYKRTPKSDKVSQK